MEIYLIIIIAVCSILLLLSAFSAICYAFAFSKRYDKNEVLKYYSAPDFGLDASPVNLHRGKYLINGFIYKDPSVTPNGATVVFCHGMGPGHIAYTTEIAYLCKKGCAVLAVDSFGCNYSEGKSVRGMAEGVKTAYLAAEYAKAFIGGKQIILMGHSWGAYSALCASALTRVDKVVAISAPDSPSKTIANGAARVISKPFAYILRPFWYLINFFIFGKNGNLKTSKCVKKSGTPTLLVHGDKDDIVSFHNSAYKKANGGNVTKLLAKDKAHNPYNTANAEQKLKELTLALAQKKDKSFFDGFDFKAATEEDLEIMQKISDFCEI